ncbi:MULTISPECIES: ABC transporter ATPase [unclassified Leeuwenhoekiella]|uniref:ABC transporter ATPase n=1 Tax=unclassified Leeuwenhoekiella TaxID=2615029 RepID=UPI000C6835E8|nr:MULTISPECIES: ABC transporter ATPase [unclassified Leeuwenhoekiella]MAW94037.1 ABC transporter ATPase [Leeuwenhoekiella sp.]MBA80924.1 ABC transporter ATPase [Leeuwenhoekiella sp.]|tara:strand:+ start:23282 stop:23767 length:486 start_codon:yes stop_codon:yes gene_type:complete
MLIQFQELPKNSRIWIYQSDRKFTDEELPKLNQELSIFLEQWTAHGANLNAAFEIKYDRFIVIGLDQNLNAASGCSIDAQVRFIQKLENDYEVSLLDKMNVTYIQNDRLHFKPLADFKKMAKDGAVGKNTTVFNNLVNTVEEYEEHWEVPAIESWHNRFFK